MGNRGPLLDHLDAIEEKCEGGDLSLKDIFDILGTNGHYVLTLFLIIPFLQPIPLFGLSTPFGILIALVAALAYFNKAPWVPKKWGEKRLPSKTVFMIAQSIERLFEKLAFLIRPRFKFMFEEPFRTINTLVLISNAMLLALPIPIPFSNALPGWGILFQTIGQLENDGLFGLLSFIVTTATIVFFIALFKGASIGLDILNF